MNKTKLATLALLVAYSTVGTGCASPGTGIDSTTYGDQFLPIDLSSTARGWKTIASGSHSTTYGSESIARGSHSTAVGSASGAGGHSSVALGAGSKATEDNTVSVGSGSAANADVPATRRIVNVTAGKKATDAVNKAQLDAQAAEIADLKQLIEALMAQVEKLASK